MHQIWKTWTCGRILASLTLFGTPNSSLSAVIFTSEVSLKSRHKWFSLYYQFLNLYFCLAYGKKPLTGFPELTFFFLQTLSYYSQSCHLKMQKIHNFIQPSSLFNTFQWLPVSLKIKPKYLTGLSHAAWSGSCLPASPLLHLTAPLPFCIQHCPLRAWDAPCSF